MFSKNTLDDAVSPVVAVILMVAVTVILAAVIASFVLDLGSNVQANPQAGVTFDQTENGLIDTTTDSTDNPATQEYQVTVQTVSLENADSVQISASDSDGTVQADGSGGSTSYAPNVGTSSLSSAGLTSEVTQLTAGDEITVTGEVDGKEAVLQTYTVE